MKEATHDHLRGTFIAAEVDWLQGHAVYDEKRHGFYCRETQRRVEYRVEHLERADGDMGPYRRGLPGSETMSGRLVTFNRILCPCTAGDGCGHPLVEEIRVDELVGLSNGLVLAE